MHAWDDTEQFLVAEATQDLIAGDMIRPVIVAFRGEDPLLVAFLREFEKGRYAEPMIEVLSVTGGLGADRLIAGFGARVWSLEDPVPPVVPGVGDLRQRVLQVNLVDGAGATLVTKGVIHPYDLVDGRPVWGERMESEAPEGWAAAALRITVEHRDSLVAPASALRSQVLRCDRLGHLVGLAPEVSARLGMDDPAIAG